MKFLIHMIGLNRYELSRKCIDSVRAHSQKGNYHLALTDNASTDGTRDYFQKLLGGGDVTVTRNSTNEGFIGPNNKAFELGKQMRCTYFIALNNDVEVPPGWLDLLVEPLDKDPLGVLSGPEGTCRTLHANMNGYPGDQLEYIEGSCLCAKISLVATQGPLFSTYLDFIYGDDSDLSLRMREAGYHIYQAPFTIKHVQCATTHDPAVRARCKAAQQHNHAVGMKRWGFYLRHRHFRYPLVVKRAYAVGDVILAAPIVERLKAENPARPIWVQTDFPEVFRNNPNVEKAEKSLEDFSIAFPTVDLNGAYEKEKEIHLIEAYRRAAQPQLRGDVMPLGCPKLYPSSHDILWAKNLAKNNQFSPKVCVMHTDPGGWPGKTWPIERLAVIATKLVGLGWHVVAIGQWQLPAPFDAFNLIGKTSILQLAALLKQSNLFIGPDSGPMHVALCMNCPVVGLFGVTSSRYIVHGDGPRVCLDAPGSIPCAGLRHRVPGREHIDCDPACIRSHSVDDVMAAIERLGVL